MEVFRRSFLTVYDTCHPACYSHGDVIHSVVVIFYFYPLSAQCVWCYHQPSFTEAFCHPFDQSTRWHWTAVTVMFMNYHCSIHAIITLNLWKLWHRYKTFSTIYPPTRFSRLWWCQITAFICPAVVLVGILVKLDRNNLCLKFITLFYRFWRLVMRFSFLLGQLSVFHCISSKLCNVLNFLNVHEIQTFCGTTSDETSCFSNHLRHSVQHPKWYTPLTSNTTTSFSILLSTRYTVSIKGWRQHFMSLWFICQKLQLLSYMHAILLFLS